MNSYARAQGPAEDEVEAIVITGSRIARSDYVAESPILTLGADAISARGPTTIDQVFNATPQFTASNQSSANNPSRGGRMNANLRGLGIQRTLVLVDGRRVQPADALGAVDLNSIATGLVEKIEIITGGASAVYGSDAIGGVVNFQLKRNMQGVELDVQYGKTGYDDGVSKDVALTMGSNFADDRGNVIVALSYLDRELIRRGSRPFFARSGIASALWTGTIRYTATGTATNQPSVAVNNAVWGAYPGGVIPSRASGISLNRDGTLFTPSTSGSGATFIPIVNYRGADMDPWILAQGFVGYTLGRTYPVQTPITRYQGFFRARYDLTDNLEVYAQFNHMEYTSGYIRGGWAAGQTAPFLTVPVSNPFIQNNSDLRRLLASRPRPNEAIEMTATTEKLGDSRYTYNYDLNEYMIGAKGNLTDDLTFDAYASYGTTTAKEKIEGFMSVSAWNTLVNAPDAGASICGFAFNPFNYERLSDNMATNKACYDFLERSINEQTELDQVVAEATLSGKLFELPAGDSQFAGGVSYRRQAYTFEPDGQRVRNEVWPVQQTAPTGGSYNVSEAFVEVYAPLLKDLPLIQELSTSIAYRYSDYNLFGGVNTYKATLDWQLVDSVRLRGGYQRAIRAPSLHELYAPGLRGSKSVGTPAQGAGDPCSANGPYILGANGAQVQALCLLQGAPIGYTNNGASISGVSTGNVNLKEEVADTYTVGVVWQSKFENPYVSGLSASLDYYDITVEDAIGQITSALGLNRCFSIESNPTFSATNQFCQLTTRNSDGTINTQLEPTLNLASYKVAGYDFQTDWRWNFEDIGLSGFGDTLAFNFVASYLDKYKVQAVTGQNFIDYDGTIGFQGIDSGAYGVPKWKLSASLTYAVGFLEVAARWRYIDSMEHYLDRGDTTTRAGVAPRQYLDLDAKFTLTEQTEARLGLINATNVEPAVWTGDGATDLANYDLIGRRWYVGIHHKF